MKEQLAKDNAERVFQSTRSSRLNRDTFWALSMAYASGRQWGWISRRGAGQSLQRLKEVIDPGRQDVRVTYNFISELVRRTTAGLKPRKISSDVQAKTSEKALVNKHVYDSLLASSLLAGDALWSYRANQRPRCVLGTGYLRREIYNDGRTLILPDTYQPKGTSKRDRIKLRTLKERWAVVLPFEMIRDPAADTPYPHMDEQIVGHEKPRPVEWVARNYGVKIETGTTFGSLMHFEGQLARVAGIQDSGSAQNSTQPAVIVYDFFLQDPNEPGDWQYEYIAYYDPSNPGIRGDRLHKLHFGKSPFYGLPFHPYHYETRLKSPYGIGIPLLLKQFQDMSNIAASTMMRVLIDHAGPKWRYEKESVEHPEYAFSNRTDTPIAYTRQINDRAFTPPERVSAPGANPMAGELLFSLKSSARDAINMADIQFGKSVKRGQSGEAYKIIESQAESVLDDMRQDDIIETEKLLMGTLIDTCRLLKLDPKQAMEMVGGEFPRDMIASALRDGPLKHVKGVTVLADPLRNKSPGVVRDEFSKAALDQLISPEDAVWEMLSQGGVSMNTLTTEARKKQLYEIEQILAGAEPEVTVPEDHTTAMRVIQEFLSCVGVYRLTKEQKEGVEKHWAAHKKTQTELMLWEQQSLMEQPAEPSQPAMGSEPVTPEPTALPAGTVGPAAQVA